MTASPLVVIVTNGNVFANIALSPILVGPRAYEISVVVTSSSRRPDRQPLAEAIGLAKRWGLRYTAYKVATALGPGILDRFGSRALTVAQTCRQLGIPCIFVSNINEPSAVEWLRMTTPAVLVSYSCPYRILPEVLAVPSIGSANVHSSLLPAYAGVCTYVHALAEGATLTGVTVHEMVEKFDAGNILAQAPVTIDGPTSVMALFTEQSQLAGKLLADVLEQAVIHQVLSGTAQDTSQRTYRKEPGRAEVVELRRRGHRLARLNDVVELVRAGRSV